MPTAMPQTMMALRISGETGTIRESHEDSQADSYTLGPSRPIDGSGQICGLPL